MNLQELSHKSVYNKYLKYKNKYLALKRLINQIGSGYFSTLPQKTNHKTYYIMADINNPDLIRHFDHRRSGILHGKLASAPMGHTFHLTLLTIEINRDSKLARLFEDLIPQPGNPHNKKINSKIEQMVTDAYNETFRNSIVVLNQERGTYYKMGKFYVKKFPVYSDQKHFSDPNTKLPLPTINAFRRSFYDKLRKHLQIPSFNWIDSPDGNYKLAIHNGETIFAVPIYDFGIGQWDPHISIVKEDDIQAPNPVLHGKISNPALADDKKASEITNQLLPLQLPQLPDINMSKDIGNVRIN